MLEAGELLSFNINLINQVYAGNNIGSAYIK
jgi:hypothetical protein